MKYASMDIGTTACKCQLFSEDGDILAYYLEEYAFLHIDGYDYVDIHAIERCVRDMLRRMAAQHEISSVAISSLGEAFVLLDREGRVLFYPMLYTDPRGEEEAEHGLGRLCPGA